MPIRSRTAAHRSAPSVGSPAACRHRSTSSRVSGDHGDPAGPRPRRSQVVGARPIPRPATPRDPRPGPGCAGTGPPTPARSRASRSPASRPDLRGEVPDLVGRGPRHTAPSRRGRRAGPGWRAATAAGRAVGSGSRSGPAGSPAPRPGPGRCPVPVRPRPRSSAAMGSLAVGGEDGEVPAQRFPRRRGGDPGDGLLRAGGDPGELLRAEEGFGAGDDGVGVGVGGVPEPQRRVGGLPVLGGRGPVGRRPGRSSRRTSR